MRNKIIIACSVFLMSLFFKDANAQKDTTSPVMYTVNSLKSGNSKDILTSFFQLALNNLTGKNKGFDFTSNVYAIMLKRNPKLNKDIFYTKYKPLRKLNIAFGIRLDSAYNFNGFSSGLKYSLIDQTDPTTSRYLSDKLKKDRLGIERDILFRSFTQYLKTDFKGTDTELETLNNNRNDFANDMPFNQTDPAFQKIIRTIIKDKNLSTIDQYLDESKGHSFKEYDSLNFAKLKASIKKNLLWTIGISDSTYKDKFEFSNISIVSELTKGIFEPEAGENNLEVNIKAMYVFSNDTIRKTRNLDRKIFSFESGLNWVIRDKTTDQPFFEIKFSGSYYRNFGNLYLNEKKDSLTINGTSRIRVYNDFWIPLEVKYDPKTGKVHASLNIKANFSGIAGILKGRKQE